MEGSFATGILRQSALTRIYFAIGFATLAVGYAEASRFLELSGVKPLQLFGLATVFLAGALLQMVAERLRDVGGLTAPTAIINICVAGATLLVAGWSGAFQLSRSRHDELGVMHVACFLATPLIAFLALHLHHARGSAGHTRAVAFKWVRDICLALAGLVASVFMFAALYKLVGRPHRPPVAWWWGCTSSAAVVSFLVYRLGAPARSYVGNASWLRTALVVPPLALMLCGLIASAAVKDEAVLLIPAGLCGLLLLSGALSSLLTRAIASMLCVTAAAGTGTAMMLDAKYAVAVVPIGLATSLALAMIARDHGNFHRGVSLIAVGTLIAASAGPVAWVLG